MPAKIGFADFTGIEVVPGNTLSLLEFDRVRSASTAIAVNSFHFSTNVCNAREVLVYPNLTN